MKPALGALLLVLLTPALAAACPVCGTAQSENVRNAFVGSTVFLSLLPLTLVGALIGLGVWHVRRKERERERSEAAGGVAAE